MSRSYVIQWRLYRRMRLCEDDAFKQDYPRGIALDLSVNNLTAKGLDHQIAAELADRLPRLAELHGSGRAWSEYIKIRPTNTALSLDRDVYLAVFGEATSRQQPPACWVPSERELASSNIAHAMRRNQHDSYARFHRWSVTDREGYWKDAIDQLGIEFDSLPSRILDLDGGPEHPRWLPESQLNIALSCLSEDHNKRAIVFRRGNQLREWTYGDLSDMSLRVATGLRGLGLSPGDAVAIDMPMTPESVAIYLGIILAGMVAVSIADSFAAHEIETRLRIGRAILVFTQDVIPRGDKEIQLYSRVKQAGAARVIVLPGHESMSVELADGDASWDQFLPSTANWDPVIGPPSAHINILFSSGTTGDPKAIPWNQGTAIKAAVDGHYHQDIQDHDIVCWPTNIGWMMGPWLIFASLINNATLALYDGPPNTRGFLEFVVSARVTVLGLVPSLVKAWRSSHAFAGLDLSHIKCFSSTGECSNEADMFALMATAGFRPIIEYCGGTEIGGGYLTGTLVQPASPALFSTPALGIDFVVLDEQGEPASRGEVFLRPPSLGLSQELLNKDHHQVYYANTPACPEGDILRRHGDEIESLGGGYFRALGRTDDTMNLGGIKVGAAEIESSLKQVGGIRELAAIAVAPGGGPSRLMVFIVFDGQPPPDLKDQLQARIKHDLNPLFRIHQLRLVDALPRTASGKVMRRLLRDQCEATL